MIDLSKPTKPGQFPEKEPPGDMFLRLTGNPSPSAVAEYPREGQGMIRIFVQPELAHTTAKLRAQDWLETKLSTSGVARERINTSLYDAMLGDAMTRELLAVSIHEDRIVPGTDVAGSPPRYFRLFRNGDDVSKLPPYEVAVLYALYLETQRRYGPGEHDFEDAEHVNVWVRRLEEGVARHPFLRLDYMQQEDLAVAMARRCTALSTLMSTPPTEWPAFLESLPKEWVIGTSSSGSQSMVSTSELEAGIGVADGEPIDAETAKKIAGMLRRDN